MKKVKWIALALVLCLGLIGGAYAAWTDFVVVNASVETGEMNVRFTDAGLHHEDGDYDTVKVYKLEDERKTLVVELENLYPKKGYSVDDEGYIYLELEILNDGSVPAEVESVIVSGVTGAAHHLKFYRGNSGDMNLNQLAIHFMNGFGQDPVMEPDEKHTTGVYVWLDDVGNTWQDKTGSFKLTFNFKQHNF